MKKIITVVLAGFIATALFAQEDVRLNDSVIFINNKPVALYAKEINKSAQRYNMEVYSFTDYVLIKAEVIKFSAPVDELKPFYYYELTFPPTLDTLAVYIKEEAFPLVLAKLIRDYKLISNDQLDKNGLNQLKAHYPGGPALVAKIKEFEDHLNNTRLFNQQVIRDRTKPVKISKEKKIIQDGVVVGYYIHTNENQRIVNEGMLTIKSLESQNTYNRKIADACIIYLENNMKASIWGDGYPDHLGIKVRGYQLYTISKPKDMVPGSVEDLLLIRICCLIEDFSL
jgi:hypothetical protein